MQWDLTVPPDKGGEFLDCFVDRALLNPSNKTMTWRATPSRPFDWDKEVNRISKLGHNAEDMVEECGDPRHQSIQLQPFRRKVRAPTATRRQLRLEICDHEGCRQIRESHSEEPALP